MATKFAPEREERGEKPYLKIKGGEIGAVRGIGEGFVRIFSVPSEKQEPATLLVVVDTSKTIYGEERTTKEGRFRVYSGCETAKGGEQKVELSALNSPRFFVDKDGTTLLVDGVPSIGRAHIIIPEGKDAHPKITFAKEGNNATLKLLILKDVGSFMLARGTIGDKRDGY